MKKYILILAVVILSSCSSDSNVQPTNPEPDAIVGKWKLTKEVFYNTTNSTSFERNADSCEDISSIDYKSNNTILYVDYYLDNSSCVLETNNWEYAKWQNMGSGSYKFTSKITGQSEETYTFNIEFQNSNVIIVKQNSGGVYNAQPYNYSKEYYSKI